MKKPIFFICLFFLVFAGKTFAEDVARVGDATYASLAAAVSAVPSGGTVTMIANTEVGSTIGGPGKLINKTFTLDLNGKIITSSVADSYCSLFQIDQNASLVIVDSSDEQKGEITCVDKNNNIELFVVEGKLTINGGRISSPSNILKGCCIINVVSGGELVINGGLVTTVKGRSSVTYGVIGNSGTTTIYGGSIVNKYSGSGMESAAIQNNGVLYALGGEAISNDRVISCGKSSKVFALNNNFNVTGNIYTYNNTPISEYILTDNADFSLPTDLNVSKITYNRGSSNVFGTVCLPFVPDSKATITYYTLKDADENTLTLETVDNIETNTPYVYYTEDGTFNVGRETATTLSASATAGSVTNSNGWTLKGTYARTTVYEEDEPNSYYIKDNAFCKVNGNFKIKPLRAYFTAPSGANSDRYEISIIDEATALNNLTEEDLSVRVIRNINGMRLSRLQRGINLVTMSNGITQKIIVK